MLLVEDIIGDGCPYADLTEFVIRTHVNAKNGTKNLDDALKKLETEQTKQRDLAVIVAK